MLDESSLTVAIPTRQMNDIDQHIAHVYYGPVVRDLRQSKTQKQANWKVDTGVTREGCATQLFFYSKFSETQSLFFSKLKRLYGILPLVHCEIILIASKCFSSVMSSICISF